MRSNNKNTAEELDIYMQMYIKNEKSYHELKKNFGLLLSRSKFNYKVLRYKDYGIEGIRSHTKNNRYSIMFKEAVVEDILN